MNKDSHFFREAKQLLQLGLPMIATQLFIMGMGFLDTAMAGHYSAADLAGVALGGNVLWPIFMFMSGLTMALTPIVAQLRGARRVAESGTVVRQGMWISLVTSFVTVLIIIKVRPIYIWMGVDDAVIDVAVGYLKAVSWGIPAIMIYIALRYTTEGLGQTKPPMIITGVAFVLNAPLNYILIYGKFGAPELGGIGCGWATAAVYWFELILMILVVKRPFFRATGFLATFEWPSADGIRNILRIGLPIGASMFVGMVVYSMIAFLVARIGVTELAAHSIAGNLNWLTYVIPMSLGSAVSIRVGVAVGAGDIHASRRIIRTALSVVLVYAICVSVVLILLRHYLVAAYTADAEVLMVASNLIIFIALYQIFDDMQATMTGALRGYKDTFIPMLISLVGYWFIALPVGYVLATGKFGLSELGVYGYWVGMTFGLFLVASAVATRLWITSNSAENIRQLAYR